MATKNILPNKILVTHPGKLGDLVYSLGVIRALSQKHQQKVSLLTSPFCQPIKKLLLSQDYIEHVEIDLSYVPAHEHRGFQPHLLTIPKGFSTIYELGYREQDTYDLNRSHLKGYGFYALKEFYGIELDDLAEPSISLPFRSDSQNYFIFQGFGETLDMVYGQEKVNNIMIHWAAVLKSTKIKVLALTGPREVQRYRTLGFETIVASDLLESTQILSQAKGVIASQSVIAAIANEMQIPRLILGVFPNAVPTGKFGKVIPLMDESVANAEYLIRWIG